MPEIRRARPEELEEVGRTTVAAYAAYLDASPETDYVDHLRDAARATARPSSGWPSTTTASCWAR